MTTDERLVRLETTQEHHTGLLEKMSDQLDRVEMKFGGLQCGVHGERFKALETSITTNKRWIRWLVIIALGGGLSAGAIKAIPSIEGSPSKVEVRK